MCVLCPDPCPAPQGLPTQEGLVPFSSLQKPLCKLHVKESPLGCLSWKRQPVTDHHPQTKMKHGLRIVLHHRPEKIFNAHNPRQCFQHSQTLKWEEKQLLLASNRSPPLADLPCRHPNISPRTGTQQQQETNAPHKQARSGPFNSVELLLKKSTKQQKRSDSLRMACLIRLHGSSEPKAGFQPGSKA